MSKQTVSETTISVVHVKIQCDATFEQARERFEFAIPKLDETGRNALKGGDVQVAQKAFQQLPELSIFQHRDHGEVLKTAGVAAKALQYDVGNPNTASKMTRLQLAAAQYAPFRVVLYEDAKGQAVFEYDKPSSLFGQFGDQQIREVSEGLDRAIQRAIQYVSEDIG